jgi:DNA polymerase
MPDSKSELAANARSLKELDEGIAHCRGCPLWQRATQAVCGEGGGKGRIMLVGEQPGDQEDLTGKPFVGPAGKVLDEALEKVGIDRKEVYVTNAVKHFSWEPRGKRRMHKTPSQQEVAACLDWLLGEIRLLTPRLIVCLGGTAVRALLGPKVKVLVNRGKFLDSEWGPKILVRSIHRRSCASAGGPRRRSLFVKDLARIKDL